MESDFSLPMIFALVLQLAAPASTTLPLPAVPGMDNSAVILQGQEALFERNVRQCLSRMAPLMPSEMRVTMARQITAQWYQSGFEKAPFIAAIDMDEMNTLAEAMEEEVLPSLEDAGYAIDPDFFRASMALGYQINRIRAIECATELTSLQVQFMRLKERHSQADTFLDNEMAVPETSDPMNDDAISSDENGGSGFQRIVY